MGAQRLKAGMGLFMAVGLQIGLAGERHQIGVAGLVLGQQRHLRVMRVGPAAIMTGAAVVLAKPRSPGEEA